MEGLIVFGGAITEREEALCTTETSLEEVALISGGAEEEDPCQVKGIQRKRHGRHSVSNLLLPLHYL